MSNQPSPPCKCPSATQLLPADIYEDIREGGTEDVRVWLSAGGDVNAATSDENTGAGGEGGGMTLLATACESGQSNVVKILLQQPVLHLNTTHSLQYGRRCSPLWLAAHMGHEECVKLLILSRTRCRLNVGLAAETKDGQVISPAMAAVQGGHWGIVGVIIAAHKTLRSDEASLLLRAASAEDRWDEVRMVLQRNLPLSLETYTPLLLRAHDQQEMGVVKQILKGSLRYKNDCVCELLSAEVERRNWGGVKDLFAYMDKDIEFDKDLAVAALEDDWSNFKHIINKCSPSALDGVRLVVAVGGASERVSQSLYSSYYSDNKHVKEGSLLLSAMNGQLEVLLSTYGCHKKTLTYAVLSKARALAARGGHVDAVKFLEIALTKKANYIAY